MMYYYLLAAIISGTLALGFLGKFFCLVSEPKPWSTTEPIRLSPGEWEITCANGTCKAMKVDGIELVEWRTKEEK